MTRVGERLSVLGSEEPLEANIQVTAAAIDTLFSALRTQFHYIIVDVPRIPAPAYRRALEMADRRIIVVDQTMRSMRDAVRVAELFDDASDERNVFVVNRVGEAGATGLALKSVETVLQVRPARLIPFVPKLVIPAASAVNKLALELSGRRQSRRWWSWRAKS